MSMALTGPPTVANIASISVCLLRFGDLQLLLRSLCRREQDKSKENAAGSVLNEVTENLKKTKPSEQVQQPTGIFLGLGEQTLSTKTKPEFPGMPRSKHTSEIQKQAEQQEEEELQVRSYGFEYSPPILFWDRIGHFPRFSLATERRKGTS